MSDNLRGAAFMCATTLFFMLNDSLIKAATEHVPLFQAIALRGTMIMLGLILLGKATGQRLWPELPADQARVGLRALVDAASTLLYLMALQHMALADISAIFQSVPLMVTLGAVLVFGEPIGWRRMTAIGCGFLGVLIIIRPGASVFDVWSVLALGSVALTVARELVTRAIPTRVSAISVSIWTAAVVTVIAYVLSIWQGWVRPQPLDLLRLAVASVALMAGYIFSVATVRVGELGFVAPFRYTALIWAISLGWLAFGTFPDAVTLIGAAIVVGSGLYAFWREQRLGRSIRV